MNYRESMRGTLGPKQEFRSGFELEIQIGDKSYLIRETADKLNVSSRNGNMIAIHLVSDNCMHVEVKDG